LGVDVCPDLLEFMLSTLSLLDFFLNLNYKELVSAVAFFFPSELFFQRLNLPF
jgi:hypothetical protein